MIDFHNHILPGVDDGSESLTVSLSMLKKAERQGITEVVNTVHFQHPKMYGKNIDYNYLLGEVEKLQKVLDKEEINIKIHLSSEVFYLPNLAEISKNPLNTIGNGKYMLIEFLPGVFPKDYEEQFYNLQLLGITPIVAHPERYKFVKENFSILEEWIDKGYIIQIDAGSIRGHFGDQTKKFTMKIVEKGCLHLIGSDAHNNKGRNFCLKKTYDFLDKEGFGDLVVMLKENTVDLLGGNELKRLINDNKRDQKKIRSNGFMNKIKNFFYSK